MIFLEIGKFVWAVIGGIFSRDGFQSMRDNWRNIATVAGIALVALFLLWAFNPFDDSAKERRLADAKVERAAMLQCSVDVLKASTRAAELQARLNTAARDAGDEARDAAAKDLRALQDRNKELEDRLRALPDRPGISARALKEMAR